MKLNRPGTFHASPMSIGLDQSKKGLASVNISFSIFQEKKVDKDDRTYYFVDVSAEQMTTIGYFYIEKHDGSINDFNIKALRESLGWSGHSLSWLEDTDLRDHPVQITVDWETYQGTDRLKVQFLNPYGSTKGDGDVTKSDNKTRRAIESRIGARLRARAGGTPSPAPIPQPPAPAGTPILPATQATRTEAWARFISYFTPGDPKWGPAEIQVEWFRILEEMFPDIDPNNFTETLTNENWARVKAEAPGKIGGLHVEHDPKLDPDDNIPF